MIIPLVILGTCVFITSVYVLTKNYLEHKQNDSIYKTYIPPTDNNSLIYTPYNRDVEHIIMPSGGRHFFYVTGASYLITGSHKLSTFDGLNDYINTAPKMEILKDIEYGCIYCGNIYTKRIDECSGCGSRKIKEISS